MKVIDYTQGDEPVVSEFEPPASFEDMCAAISGGETDLKKLYAIARGETT